MGVGMALAGIAAFLVGYEHFPAITTMFAVIIVIGIAVRSQWER